MIVVGFYTRDTPYEDEATILRRSLDRFGIKHDLLVQEDRGTWDQNTAVKPFVLRAMRACHSGPLLYVDVDAFFHMDPSGYFDVLGEQGADFGAHWFAGPSKGHNFKRDNCACLEGRSCSKEHRFLSGTLFLGDTPACANLLEVWVGLNRACEAAGWDSGGGQRNLWAVVTSQARHLRIERLPGRYCYVFDKSEGYPRGEPRVIEHTIASRDHRLEMGGRRNPARRQRRRELIDSLPQQQRGGES